MARSIEVNNMAYILRTNGTREEMKLKGDSLSMEEIQEVTGYFALVKLKNNRWAYVAEEGIPLGLPYNKSLSEMIADMYFQTDFYGDAIVCETDKEAGFDDDDA